MHMQIKNKEYNENGGLIKIEINVFEKEDQLTRHQISIGNDGYLIIECNEKNQ